MTDQTLIYSGEAVKALGAGRVGGYLIRFGSPDDHDVQGDFFTPQTYVGRAVKGGVDVIFDHGLFKRHPLAARLGNKVIGEGVISPREDGWYVEATLDVTDPAIKAAYEEAEAGRLGWSSGSTDRMVRKTQVRPGVHRVEAWPLVEASLTGKPVDPRNRATAIKSLNEDMGEDRLPNLVDRTEALVADADVLVGLYEKAADQRRSVGRDLSADKRRAIKALVDRLSRLDAASVAKVDPERALRLSRMLLASRIGEIHVDSSA